MVVVHLLYGLEVNDSFHLGLVFVCSRANTAIRARTRRLRGSRLFKLTCVVGERPAIMVEDKPTFLPGLDLSAHLDQKTSAGFVSDGQMEAGVRVVSGCLDVAVKIEVVLPYGEVACQQPGLWIRATRSG